MATNTMSKEKWRALMRRLFPRSTPYWHKGLDREEPGDIETTVDPGLHVSRVIILGMFAAVCILTPMAYVNVIVFAYPGGFARLIAEFLAEVCRATGNCGFGYLMAGFTFALQIVLIGFALIVIAMMPGKVEPYVVDDDDEDVSEHEQLDGRIVALREELMGAGILTKPPEELAEEE